MKPSLIATVIASGFMAPLADAAAVLYATSIGASSSDLVQLSTTTGAGQVVAPFSLPGFMAGLAFDSNAGVMYATSTNTDLLHTVDLTTGATTAIGPLGVQLIHGLAYHPPSQQLFGTFGQPGSNDLFAIDKTTGAASLIGSIGLDLASINQSISGLAVHPATGELYGSFSGPDDVGGLVAIDVTTGDGTLVTPPPGTAMPELTGLAFDPLTAELYGVDNGPSGVFSFLYRINPATAEATLIGPTGFDNILGLEFAMSIPEPATGALSTLAVCSGLACRRRRLGAEDVVLAETRRFGPFRAI